MVPVMFVGEITRKNFDRVFAVLYGFVSVRAVTVVLYLT